MDLLAIIQAALGELGLTQPDAVAGSLDPTTIQMLALANREGNELWRSRDWTFLQKEFVINLEAPIEMTGDIAEGSTTISNLSSSTAVLQANAYTIFGEGIPSAQRLSSITDTSTVECEMENTATDTTIAIQFQRDTYNLPDDFDHYISQTWWDRTNHWKLVGPLSPQIDQWDRSGIVTTGPRRRWRQIGQQPTAYRIWPPPTAQDTPAALVFEYVSNGWIETVGGTFVQAFTADTDVPLFSAQAMILGLKWRFWQIKGFDYAAMQAEYVDFVNREKARDGGMSDLSLTRRRFPYLLSSANVADGDWPGN